MLLNKQVFCDMFLTNKHKCDKLETACEFDSRVVGGVYDSYRAGQYGCFGFLGLEKCKFWRGFMEKRGILSLIFELFMVIMVV